MKFSKIFKRTILNIVLILLAFLLQTAFFPMIPSVSTIPNLLLILTFSFGFIYGSTQGILSGLLAGFLLDMFYTVPAGFFMLIFIYIGFINGLFTNYYYDDYLTLPVVLCIVSELIYNAALLVLRFFTVGSIDVTYSILHIFLPETVFSLLLTLLMYKVFLTANRTLDLKEDKRGQEVA